MYTYAVYLKLTRYFIFIQMIYTVHGLFQVDHIFYFSSRWYALYTFCLKFACLFSPLRWCTPIGRHVRDAKASRGHQVKVWYIKGQPISWLDSEQSHSPECPPHWSKDVDSSDWDRFNIEDTFLLSTLSKIDPVLFLWILLSVHCKICRYHLHRSRYCDIVPLHNPLTKVAI